MYLELGPSVAGEHVDEGDLAPLLHIHQQVHQLPAPHTHEVSRAGHATVLMRQRDHASHKVVCYCHINIYLLGLLHLDTDT